MRRFSLCTALLLFGLVAAPEANAFTFQVTELSGCESGDTTGCFGEEITIGIRVINDAGASGIPDDIAAFGAAFSGYDNGVVSFVDGLAVTSILHSTCIPAIGCFNGIANTEGPALSETNGRVQFMTGATITVGHDVDGLDSPGFDGIVGGGDVQFRVRFLVTGPGITTIQIGTDPSVGNVVIARGSGGFPIETTNAAVVISSNAAPYVVPEPSVALLLGLGLVGLGSRRRGASA